MADNPSLLERLKLQPRPLSPSDIARDNRPFPAEPPGLASGQVEPASPPAEPDYQSPPKKSDPLPKPGDPYRACARFLNRLSSDPKFLHFVDKDCHCEGFAYADLRRVRWLPAEEPGGGPVLVLIFVEAATTEVRVEGRNLEDIHHWVSEGSMPWVWEQPKGFKSKDDSAIVITSIRFQEVER